MTNPKLPGIPETEQVLLYAKLNEHSRGHMFYKKAEAYFVVPLRPRHSTYSVWVYFPSFEKNRLLFIHELSADINESLRVASTPFFFSGRCLLIVEYSGERVQSNRDSIISFGRYHRHYSYEILKIDPAYLNWIAYKYTPKILKQERFVAIAQVYHSAHLDVTQREVRQEREASRFLGNEGEKSKSLNLKVMRVRLEDDPYKTRVARSAVQSFVRQIVILIDPSGSLVIMKIPLKAPGPVSYQLPILEHKFRLGEIVHIASARAARTYESYGSKYTRLSYVKLCQIN